MSAIDQINGNLNLLGFKATSVTDIDEQIAIAVGQVIDNTLTEINNTESTITNILISQYGYLKSAYYVAYALYFQYGYNLSVDMAINPATGEPFLDLIYTTIDDTAKIIKQAAFEQVRTMNAIELFLKIATIDTLTNLLIPLSNPQLAAFNAYMENFEAPGLRLNIINQAGNVLNFNAVATFSSAYDLTALQTNVANALVAFQTVNAPGNFQTNFQFNGVLYVGQLQDYVKANVPGVIDFYVNNTTLDNVPFAGSTALSSGYFNYVTNITDNISYVGVQS